MDSLEILKIVSSCHALKALNRELSERQDHIKVIWDSGVSVQGPFGPIEPSEWRLYMKKNAWVGTDGKEHEEDDEPTILVGGFVVYYGTIPLLHIDEWSVPLTEGPALKVWAEKLSEMSASISKRVFDIIETHLSENQIGFDRPTLVRVLYTRDNEVLESRHLLPPGEYAVFTPGEYKVVAGEKKSARRVAPPDTPQPEVEERPKRRKRKKAESQELSSIASDGEDEEIRSMIFSMTRDPEA